MATNNEWEDIANKPQFLTAKNYAVGDKVTAKCTKFEGMEDNKFGNRRAKFTINLKGANYFVGIGSKNIRKLASEFGIKNPEDLVGKNLTFLIQATNTGNSFEVINASK